MLNTGASLKNFIFLFLQLEWRQKYAVQGVLVQMFTSVFLVFLSIQKLSLPVWNSLFWLMVLFNTMNTIAKGFLQDSEGKLLYYHSLCKPHVLILARIFFNAAVSLFLLLVFSVVYGIVLGFKVQLAFQYFLVAIFFTIGLSSVFTMVSAMAAGAGNNYLLVPVLGLPLILPLLLITVRAAKKAMDGLESISIYYDISALFLLDIMLVYLSVMLYRYLWKN